MKKFQRLFLCTSMLVCLLTGQDQSVDQSVVISQPLRDVTSVVSTATLNRDAAANLIDATCGSHTGNYILHAVRFQDTGARVQEQNWYVYSPETATQPDHFSRWIAGDPFEGTRIYGRRNVSVVYVYLTMGTARAATGSAQFPATLSGLSTTDKPDEIKNDILQTLFGEASNPHGYTVVNSYGHSVTGIRVRALTGTDFSSYLVDEDIVNELNKVSYHVDITKTTPGPLKDLQDLLGLAIPNGVATKQLQVTGTPVAFGACGPMTVSYLPSKMDVTAHSEAGDKDVEIGKNTFDNEKKYWYDFSLGLPLSSYNEIRYDQTNDQISAKSIDKKNLFAFFNAGLPRDTYKLQRQVIPVLLYGIPIAGQPLKHHIFAASFGLNKVNFFVGVRLDDKKFYKDFSQPLIGANVTDKWRTHLAYGINFPVSTVVQALKKSSK